MNVEIGRNAEEATSKVSNQDIPLVKEESSPPRKKKHVTKAERKKPWNDMSHMSVKRFRDDDPTLTAGAKRNRAAAPYAALVEVDPSGRSACKLCGSPIEKGVLRLGLMMECHKGFRTLCTLHEDCFWKHPETKKLMVTDVFFRPNVDASQKEAVQKRFSELEKAVKEEA